MKSTEMYFVAIIISIVSVLWTGGMVYLYLYKGMTVASVPFFMLSLIGISGYLLAVCVIFIANETNGLEKLYRSRY